MSLINEALKKARIEAAQRDAEQRGVLVPKAAAYAPRRRTGRTVAAAVAAVAALGLAAAGGMWLARRGASDEVAREASAGATEAGSRAAESGAGTPAGGAESAGGSGAEGTSTPAASGGRGDFTAESPGEAAGSGPVPATRDPRSPEAGIHPREGSPTPRPGAAGPSPTDRSGSPTESGTGPTAGGSSAATPPTGGVVAAGEPSSAGAQPRRDSAPAAEPAAPRAPAPAPLTRSAPPARRLQAAPPGPETGHLREAPLPGGGTLRLDGIVWSETHPAAVIEGQVVGPGEYVRGARVVRVERNRVVLEAGGSEIVIRLR